MKEYLHGESSQVPKGTLVLGKDPTGVLRAVAIDASGNVSTDAAASATVAAQQITVTDVPQQLPDMPGTEVTLQASVANDPTVYVGPAGALFYELPPGAVKTIGVISPALFWAATVSGSALLTILVRS